MKIHNELQQGSDEWLQIRCGKFTGSDFHDFLSNFGKDKVSETVKLKLLKKASEIIMGKREEKSYTNDNMIRGNELEPEAREMYQEYSFNLVKEVGFIELNKFTGCSPDGLVEDDGMIEIKCPLASTFINHFVKGDIAIKPVYRTQIQFNLFVSGRKWCDYVCYNCDFKNPLFVKRIYRDEEYIARIKDCLQECTEEVNNIIENYRLKNK